MALRTVGGIYAIINTGNGKIYIGSTVNLRKRWHSHGYSLRKGIHENPHLQHAWNKHGESAFEFGALEYLDNPEELHLAEQFWVDIYREEGKELYNIGTPGRAPWLGRKRSKETCRKISEASKGRYPSKETRRKLSESRKGKKMLPRTEKWRREQSEAMSGENHYFWGKHFSEEHRRKIGEANAGYYLAFVHRETGETIPAGFNLRAMCRETGLGISAMCRVKNGRQPSYRGWELAGGIADGH